MIASKTIQEILTKYKELERVLSQGDPSKKSYVESSKEYQKMSPIATKAKLLLDLGKEQKETEALLESGEGDAGLIEYLKGEQESLKRRLEEETLNLRILLLPKDEDDEKNIILEIRAGTGGEEAALFAGDLLRMYQRYSDIQGWKVEVLNCAYTDLGGVKEVALSIQGGHVFEKLKYEGGAHRVQRVPHTESAGRIHTSVATVAVLPEAKEAEVDLQDKDLRIDVYRSSGPGGQSVNTTDSAVRVTHIPTGTVVIQQDEKSQHKNKAKALRVLRSRLLDLEKRKKAEEEASARSGQVGSGDRSERIRTYNFPQGRVTDHRINFTSYKLPQIMEGEGLEELIQRLAAHYQAQSLADLAPQGE